MLAVLRTPLDKAAVAQAVTRWRKDELEAAVIEQGGCAAAMRTQDEWARHPQGLAVRAEPLLIHDTVSVEGQRPLWSVPAARPLQGVRVLDLTRILAGPVATRFLAGFGADVLRIDPIDWDEPNTVPEVVLGKRSARVDLKSGDGRAVLRRLIRDADERRRINPGLVDVSLDAYGWSGPWRGRRGFDSLVQTSTGLVETAMRVKGADRPVPLPVQALDHGTGYLLAAAALRGLTRRLATNVGTRTRGSLARTSLLLSSGGLQAPERALLAPEEPGDLDAWIEETSWGSAQRVRVPARVDGVPMRWAHPARTLGFSTATW